MTPPRLLVRGQREGVASKGSRARDVMVPSCTPALIPGARRHLPSYFCLLAVTFCLSVCLSVYVCIYQSIYLPNCDLSITYILVYSLRGIED